MRKRPKRYLWVCRDSIWYSIYLKKREVRKDQMGCWFGCAYCYCAKEFERITGIKLKPGEGPVRCEVPGWRREGKR